MLLLCFPALNKMTDQGGLMCCNGESSVLALVVLD